MSLDGFIDVHGEIKPKKKIEKKTEKKEKVVEDPFQEDAEEIKPFLIEVFECSDRKSLLELARLYTLTGVSSKNMDEIRDELYDAIRDGKTKNISAFEKREYSQWEYTCGCKKPNFHIVIRSKQEPHKRYCKHCSAALTPKKLN